MSETVQDKARTVLDRLADKLADLTTLRIETAVTPMEVAPDGNGGFALRPKQGDAVGIVTEIEFVEGDIAVRLSPDLLDPARKDLLDFHAARVAESQAMVHANIAAMVALLRDLMRQQ